jgi:hypothetical protein
MLLHLPIAILATLSPIAVSDTVPKFDTVRECRIEVDRASMWLAVLATKLLHFGSSRMRGRNMPVRTGRLARPRRQSAISRALSTC